MPPSPKSVRRASAGLVVGTPKHVSRAKQKSSLTVSALPAYQRPRERLLEFGPTNITTAELLAIIIGHGTAGCGVLDLAQKAEAWLAQADLAPQPAKQSSAPGLSRALTLKLIAIHELCRRSQHPTLSPALTSPKLIVDQITELSRATQERVIALYVDARFHLIEKRTIAIGKQNSVQLEPRDIFAPALILPAHGVVVVHNHPSGNPEPSSDDLNFTQRVLAASQLLGITLVDHIIVGKKSWYSFGEHGLHDQIW